MTNTLINENERQKANLIDQLWQTSNILTGYSVIQGFTLLFMLASLNGEYIRHAWWIVASGLIVICIVLLYLIKMCFRNEIHLRKELYADESIISTCKDAYKFRMFLIVGVHLLTSSMVILHKFAKGG